MEAQNIVQLITELVNNSLFPIAAFLLMWYSHEHTIKAVRDAISDNTTAIVAMKEAICNHKEG